MGAKPAHGRGQGLFDRNHVAVLQILADLVQAQQPVLQVQSLFLDFESELRDPVKQVRLGNPEKAGASIPVR